METGSANVRENPLKEKSYKFAVRIVKAYKHIV